MSKPFRTTHAAKLDINCSRFRSANRNSQLSGKGQVDVRIIDQDMHTESAAARRHFPTQSTKSDDTESLSVELLAHQFMPAA